MNISGISIYSLASAIIFFNIGLLLIKLLRRNTAFLIQNSTKALIVLFGFSIIRVILPFDMKHAIVIQSKVILPFIINLFEMYISKSFRLGTVLIGIWIVGAVLIMCKSLYAFIREIQQVKNYRVVNDIYIQKIAEECLNGKAVVIVSPDVDVPKATGINNAYIYVPPLKLTDKEIRMVLLHEYQHIKGRDIFIKLFYFCLKVVFWWNPVVHIFQKEVENLLELRCDAAVTRGMTSEERIIYLETILNVIKQFVLQDVGYSINTASLVNFNTQNLTRQRFEVILNNIGPYIKSNRIRNISIIGIAFICSYFVIVQPAYYPVIDEIEGNVNITNENAQVIVEENGKMEVYVDGDFYGEIEKEDLDIPPFDKLNVIRKEEVYELYESNQYN